MGNWSGWGENLSQLIAGTNITLSPTNGKGVVTVNSTGVAPSGVDGSIQFSESSAFASDNANLFWDNASNRLGIGTASPDTPLEVRFSGADGLKLSDGTDELSFGYDATDNRFEILKTNPDANQIWIQTSNVAAGAIIVANNDTDNTDKEFRCANFPYVMSQSPAAVITGISTTSTNEMTLGGKSGSHQAMTNITFYTASAVNTASGTERMAIIGSGLIGMNESDPEERLHVDGNILLTGAVQNLVTANEAIAVGDCIKISGAVDNRVVRTTATTDSNIIGVAETSAAGAGSTFHMAIDGLINVTVNNTVARGDFLRPSATAGRAESVGTTAGVAIFGLAMDSGTIGTSVLMRMKKAEIF